MSLLAQHGAMLAGGGEAAETDPHYDKVISLLTFDDGTLADNKGKVWTPVGGAAVVDGELVLDGSDDRITTLDHADWDFGSGDFCVEMLVALNNLTTQILVAKRNVGGYTPFGIQLSSGKLNMLCSTSGSSWAATSADTINFVTGVLTHVGLSRAGNTLRLVKGGSVVATGTVTGAVMVSANAVDIGFWRFTSDFFVNGRIGAWRATKGEARYTGPYTPPTSFPTAGP